MMSEKSIGKELTFVTLFFLPVIIALVTLPEGSIAGKVFVLMWFWGIIFTGYTSELTKQQEAKK